mmetsp:Transcript_97057/g.222425  ORF Transcript_97057/g.222425 Transcript_97057/m.222425 type:complete len:210 (+) Transcript_97057:2208-2837(+)
MKMTHTACPISRSNLWHRPTDKPFSAWDTSDSFRVVHCVLWTLACRLVCASNASCSERCAARPTFRCHLKQLLLNGRHGARPTLKIHRNQSMLRLLLDLVVPLVTDIVGTVLLRLRGSVWAHLTLRTSCPLIIKAYPPERLRGASDTGCRILATAVLTSGSDGVGHIVTHLLLFKQIPHTGPHLMRRNGSNWTLYFLECRFTQFRYLRT